jgi:hypothetical protein
MMGVRIQKKNITEPIVFMVDHHWKNRVRRGEKREKEMNIQALPGGYQ